MSHPLPNHDAISARAYAIWEKCGRPPGCETEHWLRAERELLDDARQAAALHGEQLRDKAASGLRRHAAGESVG